MIRRLIFYNLIATTLTMGSAFSASLDDQERCAKRAEEVFRRDGYNHDLTRRSNGDFDVTAEYESHYNDKLSRCFMLLETDGAGNRNHGWQYKYLLDAYGQRVYADYVWAPKADKKYWEVPPFTCRLRASHTEEQLCQSEEEFKAFVARYME